jgi:hypothetical protein
MKSARVLILGLALGLASTQAHALVDVSAFGGYATLAMGDVNNTLDKFAASGAGGKSTDLTSGFYVGADAGISVLPFLKVGPRLKYIQAGEGKVTFNNPTNNATIDANLMMYEVGVSADMGLPLTGLSVQGGLWGGYGMANASVTGGGGPGGTQTGTGNAFVGEIAAQLRYKLVAGLSIGVDLGYTMANIATVNGSNGQPFISNGGKADAFDYSGLNAGGAVSWGF